MERESALELISEITEFNDLSGVMDDAELDMALANVVKLIMRPDVPPAKAPALIVQLQALSAKFQMLAMYYTNVQKGRAGSEEAIKKNVYYSASDSIDKLVAALKYAVKSSGL